MDSVINTQIFAYGPTVVLLVVLIVGLLKFAPTWKEIRLKQIEAQQADNDAKIAQSTALNNLAESFRGINEGKRMQAAALTQLASVLQSIAVEQRRATEEVGITQRANADATDRLQMAMETLTARLGTMEEQYARLSGLDERVEKLEHNA